jgi:hypothetical protein
MLDAYLDVDCKSRIAKQVTLLDISRLQSSRFSQVGLIASKKVEGRVVLYV